MSLAKPVMRGLLVGRIRRHLIIASTLSVLAGISYKYLVMEKRKQVYAEFYKNYDAQADFERMKNLGLFESCGPKE